MTLLMNQSNQSPSLLYTGFTNMQIKDGLFTSLTYLLTWIYTY